MQLLRNMESACMNNPINMRVSQSGHCGTLHSSKSSVFMVEKSAKSPLKKNKRSHKDSLSKQG